MVDCLTILMNRPYSNDADIVKFDTDAISDITFGFGSNVHYCESDRFRTQLYS